MTQSDAYYRALAAYRAAVAEKRECARDSKVFSETVGDEKIKVTRANCIVDEEWVREIEKGLVFIEKAIKEERQFIYSNGEVIPIEKVKNVSRDSVEHLARHSELITRVTEGEDLIPDKLYTVERYSDYTVYENRFLYMLLCYLRDFVTLRYQKVLEITCKYNGELGVNKSVTSNGRTLHINIDMHEERRDDQFLREHNPAKDLIDRMDLILKTVLAFLATPLMESAGKAPMLKPPITKTNVLKMDNNFKGAVALYEYIIAYEGPGYTVENTENIISPFNDDVAEDMAELELLLSFVAYKHGLSLTDALKASFEVDQAKEKLEELERKTKQIASVRRRLENEGQPVEEYIIYLEKHVRALQTEVNKISSLYEEIDAHKETERTLEGQIFSLNGNIEALEDKAKEDAEKHAEALYEVEQRYMREMTEFKQKQSEEMLKTLEKCEKEAFEAKARAEKEIFEVRNERNIELENAKQAVEKFTVENTMLLEQNQLYIDENYRLNAQLWGLRSKKKQVTREEIEALTEKDNFDQLEKELDAFVRFYKKEWTRAKRKIRKDLLNMKNIKGQSNKK